MTQKEPLRPLIGFHGLAGAGKSTAADYLGTLGYAKVSFADPLRSMLSTLGVSYDDMRSRKNVPHAALCAQTPRRALQTLGTEWGRKLIGDNIWVEAAIRRANALRDQGVPVVFDDVRFDNEANAIRGAGGVIVKLERPGLVKMDHVSEAGVNEIYIDWTYTAPYLSVEELQQFAHKLAFGS
jgi:hypothetical protein